MRDKQTMTQYIGRASSICYKQLPEQAISLIPTIAALSNCTIHIAWSLFIIRDVTVLGLSS